MPEFTAHTLALTDDTYDREYASDRFSRFGAYLARKAGRLHDGGQPLTGAEFAFSTWQIATGPVMSPGYVHIRPDLHALTLVSAGEDGHDVALRIDVPLRHRALGARHGYLIADWQPDVWATGRGGFVALAEPEPAGRNALLVTATLLLPVPATVLVTPSIAKPGTEMTRQAKQAVAALVDHANAHAHLVNDLTTGSPR